VTSNLNKCLIHAKRRGATVDKYGNVFGIRGNKLNLTINTNGYKAFSVRLSSSKRFKVTVHRFVAYYKYGDIIFKDGIQVRHLDGNKLNNSWDNIDIGTAQMNSMDRPKRQRIKQAASASTNIRKFDDDTMQDILIFYHECRSYKLTMEMFGIKSKGTLWYMLNKTYKTSLHGHGQNNESKVSQ